MMHVLICERKMLVYFGTGGQTTLDLDPDDVINIVPIKTAVGSVHLTRAKRGYRAMFWDGQRFVQKLFPIKEYASSSDARAAAQKYMRDHVNVSTDTTTAIKVCEITEGIQKYFRYVPRGIDYYDESPIPLDPYFLGCWLGDGHSRAAAITNIDEELLSWLYQYATERGWTFIKRGMTVYFPKKREEHRNPLMSILRSLSLIRPKADVSTSDLPDPEDCQNEVLPTEVPTDALINERDAPCKHIPDIFLRNSKENRLKLLAGLIDTDGHLAGDNGTTGWEISQKVERLILDIKRLAEGLGFFTYLTVSNKCATNTIKKIKRPYFRLVIYATRFTPAVPVLIPRKAFLDSGKNAYYPPFSLGLPRTTKKLEWTEQMNAHLQAAIPKYSNKGRISWTRMGKEEEMFKDITPDTLRGHHYDHFVKTQRN